MIRFTTIEGRGVAVEPRHIVSAESVSPIGSKSLLSGNQQGTAAVQITLVTGLSFVVADPNGSVIAQIEDAKKAQP